jgi:hypothetical protein
MAGPRNPLLQAPSRKLPAREGISAFGERRKPDFSQTG